MPSRFRLLPRWRAIGVRLHFAVLATVAMQVSAERQRRWRRARARARRRRARKARAIAAAHLKAAINWRRFRSGRRSAPTPNRRSIWRPTLFDAAAASLSASLQGARQKSGSSQLETNIQIAATPLEDYEKCTTSGFGKTSLICDSEGSLKNTTRDKLEAVLESLKVSAGRRGRELKIADFRPTQSVQSDARLRPIDAIISAFFK